MNGIGKERMIEILENFLKHEKINIDVKESDYMEMSDGLELLMCEDFKVICTPTDDGKRNVSIHVHGSLIPCMMQIISET